MSDHLDFDLDADEEELDERTWALRLDCHIEQNIIDRLVEAVETGEYCGIGSRRYRAISWPNWLAQTSWALAAGDEGDRRAREAGAPAGAGLVLANLARGRVFDPGLC